MNSQDFLNDVFNKINVLLNKSYLYPKEADIELHQVFLRLDNSEKITDEKEKSDYIKKLFTDVRVLDLKYSEETKILRQYPEFNDLIDIVNMISLTQSDEEKNKKIDQFNEQKKLAIKKFNKLISREDNKISKLNTTLRAINSIFENEEIKAALSHDELYYLMISYHKLSDSNVDIIENKTKEITKKIWSNASTDVSNFKNGNEFQFIVHNFLYSRDFESQIFGMQHMRNDRISCSYISNDFVGTFGDSRIGLIYPGTANIVIIGTQDLGTLEEGDSFAINNKEYSSTLLTPKLLIEEGLKLANNNAEDFDYSTQYNEILIDSSQKPTAVYYIGYDEKELNPSYIEAKTLSHKLSLPFVEINMMEYRINKNMTPIGIEGKKYIMKCIARKFYDDEIPENERDSIYKIIDDNYELFFQKYLYLKNNNQEYIDILVNDFSNLKNQLNIDSIGRQL